MKPDRIDHRILTELAANGRLSQAELSARVGLSPTAAARRQKALEEAGYIAGYQAVLGLDRLGFGATVIVRITLESQSEDALDAFEKAIVQCPSVVRCFLMSGSDDYIVAVNTGTIEDFEHIHRNELARLPRVARIQSSFALREVINRAVPPAALQRGGPSGSASKTRQVQRRRPVDA